MKIKKIATLILAVLMLVGVMAGCATTTTTTVATTTTAGTTTTGTTTAAGGTAKVAFITQNMANPSQAYSQKQFTTFGKDYNLDVTVLDAKGDAQTESQLVTNCIAQGMKVIFINPNDIKAVIPALKQAKEAGIIIGLFSSDLPADSQQYRDFFCGVNDTQAGEAAAKAFIDQFPNGATIVEIGGQAGHDAAIKRHDGFTKGLAGSKIQVLEYKNPEQWDTAQAQAIAEDMITKYGDQIQGIFCHWDNGATGIIQSLKAANMSSVYLVGVDGCKNGFNQVKSGEQSVTISQNFTNMAKKSMELARSVLDGKKVESINFIPLDVVTKANLDTFPFPEW